MTSNLKTPIRSIGLMLYIVGAFLGFVLLALSVWGDLEASYFGVNIKADERLTTLKCPVFIAEDEVGYITADIINTTDRVVNPQVRSSITFEYVTLVDEQNQKIEIPVGESRQLKWKITQENAAYDRLVLARFYQLQNYSLPSRQDSCGVVVIPFKGITGKTFFIGMFASSLGLILLGITLFAPKNTLRQNLQSPNLKRIRAVVWAYIFLGVYFLLATLLSLLGIWLMNIALMVFAVVSLIVVFSFALSGN